MPKISRLIWLSSATAAALLAGTFIVGQEKKETDTSTPKIVHYGDLKWQPALPGVELAVLDGDPEKPGQPFVLLLKCADGSGSKPHWHSTESSATVIKGTYLLGFGEQFDKSKMQPLTAGDYLRIPKGVPHFDTVKGETLLYVHGIGPIDFHWVNPEDDPEKAKPQH